MNYQPTEAQKIILEQSRKPKSYWSKIAVEYFTPKCVAAVPHNGG